MLTVEVPKSVMTRTLRLQKDKEKYVALFRQKSEEAPPVLQNNGKAQRDHHYLLGRLTIDGPIVARLDLFTEGGELHSSLTSAQGESRFECTGP